MGIPLHACRMPRKFLPRLVTRASYRGGYSGYSLVMYSEVKDPRVCVLPGDHMKLIDGSAFTNGSLENGSDYSTYMVKTTRADGGLGQVMQMLHSKKVPARCEVSEPVYYAAAVRTNEEEFSIPSQDLEGYDFYIARYEEGSSTVERAVFGPGLLSELRYEILNIK